MRYPPISHFFTVLIVALIGITAWSIADLATGNLEALVGVIGGPAIAIWFTRIRADIRKHG